MTLRSTLAVAASANQTSALDLSSASAPVNFARSIKLGDGTGAGQANRMFTDRRTLAASATEDLDLSGIAMADAFGAAVTFARIKGIIVAASPDNANNVLLGAASANQWASMLNAAGVVTLRPGAIAAFYAGEDDATGYTVTAGTGDLLKVANSAGGTSVSYDLVIIGASA